MSTPFVKSYGPHPAQTKLKLTTTTNLKPIRYTPPGSHRLGVSRKQRTYYTAYKLHASR